MKTTILKIEFSPGTEILEAFTEAHRLSLILDVRVKFEFNGVTCSIYRTSTPADGVVAYWEAGKKKQVFCVA